MADPHQPRKTFFGPYDPFVHVHDDTYYLQKSYGYCGVCGRRTYYKSLYAAEYCCSHECSNELWCDITERVATASSSRRRPKNGNHHRK
jgi:hypothetical protein